IRGLSSNQLGLGCARLLAARWPAGIHLCAVESHPSNFLRVDLGAGAIRDEDLPRWWRGLAHEKCLTGRRSIEKLAGYCTSGMWIQTNMLKPKVKRSVARIVPARAGRSADRLPATVSGAPANKAYVVPKRSGATAQATSPP